MGEELISLASGIRGIDAGPDGPFYPGQPRQLFAALTCPKTFISFTADEGAGEHSHVGAHTFFHQRAFDRLDDALA